MTPISPVLPSAYPGVEEQVCAEHQPPYPPLPAVKSADASGMITTRWGVPWSDRLRILFSGSIWVQLLTFHNKVQPLKLLSVEPTVEACLMEKSMDTPKSLD
jgi:hypothetical protein